MWCSELLPGSSLSTLFTIYCVWDTNFILVVGPGSNTWDDAFSVSCSLCNALGVADVCLQSVWGGFEMIWQYYWVLQPQYFSSPCWHLHHISITALVYCRWEELSWGLSSMILFIQVSIMCCLFNHTITVPFVLHLYLNNCLTAFIFLCFRHYPSLHHLLCKQHTL